MQFFIHCNFFCQEYKFTYLLYFTYLPLPLPLPLLLLLKKYIFVYFCHQQGKCCPSVPNQSNKIKHKNDYDRHKRTKNSFKLTTNDKAISF